jgi:3-deoxy-D-manno-octulosonate 8-phosphate phosphatase (KDO 8-P phosphatase)
MLHQRTTTNKNFKQLLPGIKLVVLDVDGVLTDGSVHCNENGEQIRVMNIKDGYALQLAVKKGILIAIISGGESNGVRLRLQKLGITEIHQGVGSKLPLLQTLVQKYNLQQDEVMYLGDDIPDLPCMSWCGIAACPSDAAYEVRAISQFVSQQSGGKGFVRDLIEQLLKSKQLWLDNEAYHW